jgi:hypothetical protein
MLLMVASLGLTEPDSLPFPERVPRLIEACLADAVQNRYVSTTADSHKYICTGESAERFWTYLESAKIEPYEQDVGSEGHWLGREFPLGACFKRLRNADGTPATGGLSCTIWIPRVSDG